MQIAKRTMSSKNTFGWVRAEVLGALINGVFLIALCFSIFVESITRFFSPEGTDTYEAPWFLLGWRFDLVADNFFIFIFIFIFFICVCCGAPSNQTQKSRMHVSSCTSVSAVCSSTWLACFCSTVRHGCNVKP